MKTNNNYIKPEIEIVEMEMAEGIMSMSGKGSSYEVGTGGTEDGSFNTRKRGLFDD